MMGWCPNANALAAKRVMVALPIDEEFAQSEKGKSIQNYDEMGWANIFRNYVLFQTVLGLFFFGLALLVIIYLFQVDFNKAIILKGIMIGIIFSVVAIVYEWKQLNRVNKQEIGMKKKFFVQTFSHLAIFFSVIMLLIFTIGKDDPFQFMVTIFFPFQWIHYPLVVYWERKNMMIIYFVKPSKWQPLALPVQAPEKG
ncbi:MAG: DUF1673 family protein [Candidatus Methanoperedens sp.]|nr:DUF1673 family protein [Candidatus Methanoperedens sp.]MCE8429526.1 DUF1673 family protein [Candidatus Methanoperedens sp.]